MIERNPDKHLVSIPGVYYYGGCSYMACSGVIMGALKDVLVITHGPTGCRYYSGINGARDQGCGHEHDYRARVFSTNLGEDDIVFGGEARLAAALDEAIERYRPACVVVCATCPVGLIGDDMRRIAAFFGDGGIARRTEELISREHRRIARPLEAARNRFGGLKAAVFEDIFRSDAYACLSDELGMDVIVIGQDFHVTEVTDEGFRVDAPQRHAGLCRLHPKDADAGGRVHAVMNRSEVSGLLARFAPDVVFSGIEEQFGYRDASVKSEQFNSDDRGVGYFGYDGIFRYARDLEMALFTSHWVTDPPGWARFPEGDDAAWA